MAKTNDQTNKPAQTAQTVHPEEGYRGTSQAAPVIVTKEQPAATAIPSDTTKSEPQK